MAGLGSSLGVHRHDLVAVDHDHRRVSAPRPPRRRTSGRPSGSSRHSSSGSSRRRLSSLNRLVAAHGRAVHLAGRRGVVGLARCMTPVLSQIDQVAHATTRGGRRGRAPSPGPAGRPAAPCPRRGPSRRTWSRGDADDEGTAGPSGVARRAGAPCRASRASAPDSSGVGSGCTWRCDDSNECSDAHRLEPLLLVRR